MDARARRKRQTGACGGICLQSQCALWYRPQMSRLGFFAFFCAPARCAFLLVSVIVAQAAPAERPPKVEPRVWQDTENGGKSRFLGLSREQTNTIRKAQGRRDRRA